MLRWPQKFAKVVGRCDDKNGAGFVLRHPEYVESLICKWYELKSCKVLAIPIWLLWRVRLERNQKLGIAAFLCLSICTALMVITRLSGRYYHGKYDNIWVFLWQHIEACTAVTMLSLTAFRSVFVEAKPGPNKARPWVPSTARLLARRKKAIFPNPHLDDLPIPSATLTGLSGGLGRHEAEKSMEEGITTETPPLSIGTLQELYIHA